MFSIKNTATDHHELGEYHNYRTQKHRSVGDSEGIDSKNTSHSYSLANNPYRLNESNNLGRYNPSFHHPYRFHNNSSLQFRLR